MPRPPYKETRYDTYFTKQLQTLVKQRGYTQNELGEMIGRGLQTGHQVFHGRQLMSFSRACEIARKLNVGVKFFVPEEDWQPTLEDEVAAMWKKLSPEQQVMAKQFIEVFVRSNERAEHAEESKVNGDGQKQGITR
jgi:transcriptional regulator with XRE-family HTH domain